MRPRAFVTYAHDSEEHKADVLDLATLLQQAGVDTELDQWAADRRRDWSTWAIEGMTTADYVIVVVSPDYKAPGDGLGPTTVNRGVRSEASVLRDLLHGDRDLWLPKLLPVLLPGHEVEEIPYFLQPNVADHYKVEEISERGIEDLYRVITGQPRLVRPPRGPVRTLTPVSTGGGAEVPLSEPLSEPLAIEWRRDRRSPTRTSRPILEVHLVPVGGAERLPVRRLAPLATELAQQGRINGLFGIGESLTVDSSDMKAWAFAVNDRKNSSGILVRRTGQRSAWSALPRRYDQAILIPEDVVEQLANLMTTLLDLDMPAPSRLAAAVGLQPVHTVIISSLFGARPTRTPDTFPPRLRIEPEEALTVEHLRRTLTEVAEELAARLVAAFRREVR